MATMTAKHKIRAVQPLEAQVLHHAVTTTDLATPAMVHEDPEALRNFKMNKGDLVSIFAGDGSCIWWNCTVKSVDGGTYLTKPQQIVELEESSLYRGKQHEVRQVGTAYQVFNIKLDRAVGATFTTARAAELDVHRREGSRAA